MLYFSGLLVALLSIAFSVVHLKQSVSNYLDPIGIAVVFGGTIAVAVITLPWNQSKEIMAALRSLATPRKSAYKETLIACIETIRALQEGRRVNDTQAEGLPGLVLRDGVELIGLGFRAERIQSILEERIFQWSEQRNRIAQSFRSLAKYPPAFGLVGTVLGLVSLMRAVSDGASSTEAGSRMAVALVATLYGLLVANLILNPAGENIAKTIVEEKKEAEVAVQAIMLAVEKATLLESQEVLNSFVPPDSRLQLSAAPETEFETHAA